MISVFPKKMRLDSSRQSPYKENNNRSHFVYYKLIWCPSKSNRYCFDMLKNKLIYFLRKTVLLYIRK